MSVLEVADYASLAALTGGTGLVNGGVYYVRGRASAGDGGEGLFRYDSGATDTAAVGIIIAHNSSGRFFRQWDRTNARFAWNGVVTGVSADQSSATQDMIDYFEALGGGVQLWWERGEYRYDATININEANIVLHGEGGNQMHDAGTGGGPATKLSWYGASNGVMVEFKTPFGVNHAKIGGVGLLDVELNCRSLGGVGLRLVSIFGGHFKRLHVQAPSQNAYYLTCGTDPRAGGGSDLPEAADTQFNLFERCTFANIADATTQAANGWTLTGNAVANTSLNTFTDCTGQHWNGHAYEVVDADNNTFIDCRAFKAGGTGWTYRFHGFDTGVSIGGCANRLINCGWDGTTGCWLMGAPSGFDGPCSQNVFWAVDNANGSGLPQVDADVTIYSGSFDNGIQFGNFALLNVMMASGLFGAVIAFLNRPSGVPAFINESAAHMLQLFSSGNDTFAFELESHTEMRARALNSVYTLFTLWMNFRALGYVRGTEFRDSNGDRVVTTRQSAISSPSGGGTQDAQARTAINSILSAMQAHGLIAP